MNRCHLSAVCFGLIAGLFSATAGTLADESARATVVCFGDSITNRGYYETLGHLQGVEAINAGVPGHTTTQSLKRMQKDVLDHQPNVVVIFFGTNDLRVDAPKIYTTIDRYTANLEAMIAACTKIDASVVLYTVPPIKHEAYFKRHKQEDFDAVGGLEKMLQDYRAAAQDVAAKHGIPVVDLNAILPLEPETHVGGLTTGGLGATDIGNKGVIGGLSREFYERVAQHYADDAAWTQDIFTTMLDEAGVSVRYQQPVMEVKKEGARIIEIDNHLPVQQLEYKKLRNLLWAVGQKLRQD